MGKEQWWNGTDRGKAKYWDYNLSQCYFVNKNLIWTGLRSNPNLHGERPPSKINLLYTRT